MRASAENFTSLEACFCKLWERLKFSAIIMLVQMYSDARGPSLCCRPSRRCDPEHAEGRLAVVPAPSAHPGLQRFTLCAPLFHRAVWGREWVCLEWNKVVMENTKANNKSRKNSKAPSPSLWILAYCYLFYLVFLNFKLRIHFCLGV